MGSGSAGTAATSSTRCLLWNTGLERSFLAGAGGGGLRATSSSRCLRSESGAARLGMDEARRMGLDTGGAVMATRGHGA